MRRRLLLGLLLLLALVLLAACTAGPNPAEGAAAPEGEVAGFWLGLWHGFIVLVALVISLFADTVTIYEVHNNGLWYNVGFVLGAAAALGGGGHASSRKRRARRDRDDD